MKNKVFLLLMLLILTCGCTKRFNVENIEDYSTKSYVENILCKPESEELIDVYKSNEDKLGYKLDDLVECKKLKINSGGYEGLWTSLFVKPLAWLIIKLGLLVKNYGISIMLIGLLIRVVLIPITNKSNNMNKNLKKAQKDLEKLEIKYKDKKDNDSMMMKNQEMMMIYKKYGINPFSSCLFAIIQMPLFFAFLEAIYRVPAFFEEKLFGLNLGMSPVEGFQIGNYWYIILVVLIGITTYFSFQNMSVSGNSEQQKQTKMMSKFMLVFIIIVSLRLPSAIALYWIVTNGFTATLNLFNKKGSIK